MSLACKCALFQCVFIIGSIVVSIHLCVLVCCDFVGNCLVGCVLCVVRVIRPFRLIMRNSIRKSIEHRGWTKYSLIYVFIADQRSVVVISAIPKFRLSSNGPRWGETKEVLFNSIPYLRLSVVIYSRFAVLQFKLFALCCFLWNCCTESDWACKSIYIASAKSLLRLSLHLMLNNGTVQTKPYARWSVLQLICNCIYAVHPNWCCRWRALANRRPKKYGLYHPVIASFQSDYLRRLLDRLLVCAAGPCLIHFAT